ncbi:hypothetical protein ACX8Z9_14420 [Arthrobacter halodurans]|uniref:PEP-CTERM protein-sorting domain-containing protein n=1 Tax=Arthrobacter halodurans TaxID=516699 RepID=A0ABV4UQ75_9MICC
MIALHLVGALAFGVIWGLIIYRAETQVGRKRTVAVARCGGGFALLAFCAYSFLGFAVWHLLTALLVAAIVRYLKGRARSSKSV